LDEERITEVATNSLIKYGDNIAKERVIPTGIYRVCCLERPRGYGYYRHILLVQQGGETEALDGKSVKGFSGWAISIETTIRTRTASLII
jgi:hypothetical protein